MTQITRQQLLERRGDLSQFLIHLTRTGDLKRHKDLYSLERDDQVYLTAGESLRGILQDRRIEARSPFGYFKYKVRFARRDGRVVNSDSPIQHDWLRAVCFTETPIDHVYLQTQDIQGRQLRFQPYGIGFREDVVKRAGGNPIFYFQTMNHGFKYALDQMALHPRSLTFKSVMPFYEAFGPSLFSKPYGPSEVDFRWEREWRIAGDFTFSLSEIAFGLCPAAEKREFEKLVNHQFPFVDPTADISVVKDELRSWSDLSDIK